MIPAGPDPLDPLDARPAEEDHVCGIEVQRGRRDA